MSCSVEFSMKIFLLSLDQGLVSLTFVRLGFSHSHTISMGLAKIVSVQTLEMSAIYASCCPILGP